MLWDDTLVPSRGVIAGGELPMHKKLWNKDYVLVLQGNAVSTIGDLMYSVAIGYWVYQQPGLRQHCG